MVIVPGSLSHRDCEVLDYHIDALEVLRPVGFTWFDGALRRGTLSNSLVS